VFGLGAILGLYPEFDSRCAHGASHRYPNFYVTAYNDGKSNKNVNSNQLLYMGNPINITCPNESDQPYNIMDMASDDVRYYLSPTQRDIVNALFSPSKTPTDPNDPNGPHVIPTNSGPAPTYDMGMFFFSLLVLWIVVSLWIGQILSWAIAKNPGLYYTDVNPFGRVRTDKDGNMRKVTDWYQNLFLTPLLLPKGAIYEPRDTDEAVSQILNQNTSLPQKQRELYKLGVSQIQYGHDTVKVSALTPEVTQNVVHTLQTIVDSKKLAQEEQKANPTAIQLEQVQQAAGVDNNKDKVAYSFEDINSATLRVWVKYQKQNHVSNDGIVTSARNHDKEMARELCQLYDSDFTSYDNTTNAKSEMLKEQLLMLRAIDSTRTPPEEVRKAQDFLNRHDPTRAQQYNSDLNLRERRMKAIENYLKYAKMDVNE
jgi:hypothetical protein